MKIYIEKNKSNDLVNKLCEHSIGNYNENASITFLDDLPDERKELAKFLVPSKENFAGWSLYCSSDILFIDDVAKLFSFKDDKYAVLKVSGLGNNSVLLWNCAHPSLQNLTFEYILKYPVDYIDEFKWLDPNLIGSLDIEWSWDPTRYNITDHGKPKAINFKNSRPWDNDHVAFGAYWERVKHEYLKFIEPPPPISPFDNIPPEIKTLFFNILKYRVDPRQEYYENGNLENIIKDLKMSDNNAVYAVDGGWDAEKKKGLVYDPYMESFILGSGGQITNYDKVEQSMVPVLFRGITKMKHMRACEAIGRDYYYIDTGYFGNVRKKLYHRITKNAMQNIGPVIERPFDRLEATGWRRKKFRPGKNILLCPPSEKAMSCFGLELDKWMEETIKTIESYTDRPIVIRKKLSRRERSSTDTMEMALEQDVHCLVTYNSIAATEALLHGKPAFTLGPNAAHALSLQDLSLIEKPHIPTVEELEAWAAHLAYCQFTEAEMKDGTAWRILNDR